MEGMERLSDDVFAWKFPASSENTALSGLARTETTELGEYLCGGQTWKTRWIAQAPEG